MPVRRRFVNRREGSGLEVHDKEDQDGELIKAQETVLLDRRTRCFPDSNVPARRDSLNQKYIMMPDLTAVHPPDNFRILVETKKLRCLFCGEHLCDDDWETFPTNGCCRSCASSVVQTEAGAVSKIG